MNRCPRCYQIYEGQKNYCDMDGERLLSDPFLYFNSEGTLEEEIEGENDQRNSSYAAWTTGLIGALVGIIICLACYAAYTFWTLQLNPRDQGGPSYVSGLRDAAPTTQHAFARAAEPAPTLSESASPEPEASAEPSLAVPDSEANNVAVTLNEGPVSTGSKSRERETNRGKTLIEMVDGSTVEVDAAWRDDQGVWYRRGGLVSFVDNQRVKAIIARAEPKTSPASDQ